MEDKLIPVLYEDTNVPMLLETVTDIVRAIESFRFIKGSNTVKNRNIIFNAVQESEGNIIVDTSLSSKIMDQFPSEMWDKITIHNNPNPYFKETLTQIPICMDMTSNERFVDALAQSISSTCKDIFHRALTNELSEEDLMNEWNYLRNEIEYCDRAISYSSFGPISGECSLVDSFSLAYIYMDKIEDEGALYDLCLYLRKTLVAVPEYALVPLMIIHKRNENAAIKEEIERQCRLIIDKVEVVGEASFDGIPDVTTTEPIENVVNSIKTSLAMSGLKPDKSLIKCHCEDDDKPFINGIIEELTGQELTTKMLASGQYEFASLDEIFADGLLHTNDIYECKGSNRTIYLIYYQGGFGVLMKGAKRPIVVSLIDNGSPNRTVNNLKGIGPKALTVIGIPKGIRKEILDEIVKESASINIGHDGTINVKKNIFESNPMDNYANLHQQLLIAHKSQSTEDMKVVLAVILYNSLDAERIYYKLKKKNSKKAKLYEKARMFYKNDFAQYYPKYLKYADENDFIQYYRDSGLGVKEYNITTDNITGIKKIINTILK